MYKKIFKRVIDFLIALIGLILLSPIFIFITLCLFFVNQGKPFFVQLRPGLHEKKFKIIKFKTMNDKRDQDNNLLPDIERLTPVGVFVRKTSLDEIPQLINVLKGDMALVGPRPLLEKYLPFYTAEEKLRHTVRPGITGWAQLKGRNILKWDTRLAYDVEYVNNMSLFFDVKIIFLTVRKIFRSEDIIVDPRSVMSDLDEERANN